MKATARLAALWAPPLILMGLIFAGSAMPSDGVQRGLGHTIAAKTVHFGEYLVLFVCLWRALRASVARRSATVAALALCAAYACSDELHQRFVEGREPALRDVAIDVAGAGTAALAVRTRARRRTRTPA